MSDIKKNQLSTTQSDQETQSSKRKTIADVDEDMNLGQMRPLQSSPLRYDVSNGLGNYQLAKLNEKSDCLSEFAESDKENTEAEVLKTPETKLNSLVTCIFDTDLTPIDLSVSPTTENYLQKRTDDSSTKFKTSLSFNEIEKSPLNDYLKSTTESEKDLINNSSITKSQQERIQNILLEDAQNSESKSLYETIDLTSRSSSVCSILLDTLTAAENEIFDDEEERPLNLIILDAQNSESKSPYETIDLTSRSSSVCSSLTVVDDVIDIDSDEKNATVKRGVDGSSAGTLMEPQPKKSKNNKIDYDEILYIGQEVSELISPLPDDGEADDKENANLMANTPLISNESLEQQQYEANRILAQVCFNNLNVIADAALMSLDNQISDRMSSNSNDSVTPKTNHPGVAEFSAAAGTLSTSRESLDNIVGNNLKPIDDRQYQIDADEVEPSSL